MSVNDREGGRATPAVDSANSMSDASGLAVLLEREAATVHNAEWAWTMRWMQPKMTMMMDRAAHALPRTLPDPSLALHRIRRFVLCG